jgi:ATP-binding cassette subfamily B (MDR/TAP) protein 6
VKFFAVFALVVEIAQLSLLALTINFVTKQTSGGSPVNHVNLPNALHFGLVVFRVICLSILFPGLFYPRIAYELASRNAEEANASTNLIAPALLGSSQYGTFVPSPQTPQDITRTHSPAPQDGVPSSANPQVSPPCPGAPGPLKPNPRTEVDEDPTWSEIGRRLRKLTPYLWPKKDRSLQFLAVSLNVDAFRYKLTLCQFVSCFASGYWQ